ncbi:hypothetical protein V5N11_006143 [Cardamine amara subsp. amara]|uniref:Uncharacterized protein n=1 Tax=Cardamine amara subsp. amara TaxID=228776 RepID=A0ABD0ZTT0_CARAN
MNLGIWKARGNIPPDADKKVVLVFVVVDGLWNFFFGRFSFELFRFKLMCSYCKKHKEKLVPDPYYGGAQGFEKVLIIRDWRS